MTIDGLTVCVNYADLLLLSLARWICSLDSLTVVTTPDDWDTIRLCAVADEGVRKFGGRCDLRLHTTNAFTAGGARFNKAAAMQEAIAAVMPWRDWVLFFDSDILPPENLRSTIAAAHLEPGRLYGGHRHLADTPDQALAGPEGLPEVVGRGQLIPGCFQLFHAADPAVGPRDTLLDTRWTHAGNYDSAFQARWPRELLYRLGTLHYVHIGEPGLNWYGRVPPDEGRRLRAERQADRARHGGSSAHERLPGR